MEQKISNSGFKNWLPKQLPDLSGKTYVITGANSGIGYQAAQILAHKGADIVLVCRSKEKGIKAQHNLSTQVTGKIDLILMDLSNLSSVREAANLIRSKYTKIDGLINNAGIMMTSQQKTIDGFDLQMGANHLGHFLWTGLLLDLVEAAKGRIIITSSLVHKFNALNIEDFMTDTNYSPMKAYTQSKLSNLMFALELDRRLKTANMSAVAIACHPGYSETNLQSTGPTGFMKTMMAISNKLVAQNASAGAIPTVLAAAGIEAQAGAYYGPQKFGESRGPVSDAKVASHALDQQKQTQLWQLSEKLVDFKWNFKSSIAA